MKHLIASLLAVLSISASRAQEFQIYWDNSIPGAHVYQWTTPRTNDLPPIIDCYSDLGALSVGVFTCQWFDDPRYGGAIVITTPDGFAAFCEETGSVGIGAIQVWGWGGGFGGDVFEDSVNTGWDFGVIEFPLTVPHIIPDGVGGWVEGDPYVLLSPVTTPQTQHGKKLGHYK